MYASRIFDSIELNGTFYSLKKPSTYQRWVDESPPGFIFSVKGSRFITHNLKLRNAELALANFYAAGVLALGRKTGPFLWQLPATYAYVSGYDDAELDEWSSRVCTGGRRGTPYTCISTTTRKCMLRMTPWHSWKRSTENPAAYPKGSMSRRIGCSARPKHAASGAA